MAASRGATERFEALARRLKAGGCAHWIGSTSRDAPSM